MNALSKVLVAAGALVFTCNAHATQSILSFNFTGGNSNNAPSSMLAGDLAGAGAARSANWNNLNGAAAAGLSGFAYDHGGSSDATVGYSTDLGTWSLGHAVSDGDDRMWKGYLDAANSATVEVSGLEYQGSYDVYVYFDGSNGSAWRKAGFQIGAVFEDGEDTEGTSWGIGNNVAQAYQLPVPGPGANQPFPGTPNNDEGNYVILRGITGSSFTLNAIGGANSNIPRAPINGFQIVGNAVPEPATASLGMLGLAGLAWRRRRSD